MPEQGFLVCMEGFPCRFDLKYDDHDCVLEFTPLHPLSEQLERQPISKLLICRPAVKVSKVHLICFRMRSYLVAKFATLYPILLLGTAVSPCFSVAQNSRLPR